jgi:two-component system, cell cycle sensor histidine kinase and response regulator CckA
MLGDILDTLDVGILLQDAAAHIIWSNRRARLLLRVEEEELRARSSFDPRWEVIHLDGSPFPGATHPAVVALATGRTVKGVLMGVARPASERIWLLVDAFPQLDDAGNAFEVVVSFVDVSTHQSRLTRLNQENAALEKLMEATLEASSHSLASLQLAESRYRATVNAMAEGVVILAPSGNILDANPAAQGVLGMSLETLRQHTTTDSRWGLSRPDGTPLPAAEVPGEKTARTGEAVNGKVLSILRADGARRLLEVNTTPIRQPDSVMLGVVATFTDITHEREAEFRLQSSGARLQLMTEAVPGVLFELFWGDDESRSFRYLSPGARAVLGLEPADGVHDAAAVWACLHPEDLERLVGQWQARRAAPAPFEVDARLRGAGARWSRWRFATPTRAGGGWLLHGLVLDVTEQLRIEETLRRAQQKEPLGVLAAGIAHNFNNMLLVILLGLEHVRARVEGPEREMLDDAATAAGSASALVRQLMSLVRRARPDDVMTVNVVDLASDVISLCRKTFDSRVELALLSDIDDGALVRGHRTQLQQVLLNLCINARDAMVRTPAPALTIRLTREAGWLVIAVSDTGEGMSDATRLRLGELFFTTKPPGAGTGLGIATTQGIIRDLGGTLEWSSTLGVGSTFSIRLPQAGGEASHEVGAPGSLVVQFHGETVLVIDDDAMVRRTLVRQLRLVGLTVIEADGGRQGLAVLDNTVRAVLVDLSMPDMGGDQVLATLRASRPKLPVLVLSGYVPEGTNLEGAWAVIQKPYASEILARHLAAAFQSATKPPLGGSPAE